jgi:hypothetical protein
MVIKPWRLRWAEYAERGGEIRNAYRILVAKSGRKKLHG